MPKQASLPGLAPDLSRYEPFGDNFPDDYPFGTFQPFHPAFTKRGEVSTNGRRPRRFYVDLAIGECNCAEAGYAFAKDPRTGKWYNQRYCQHKMRMLSSITAKSDDEEISRAYQKALATRYNPFELVSAFHKELRRGDFEAAWTFGVILSTKRSIRGVFDYLLNIIYEETRDHDLHRWLLDCRRDPKKRGSLEWMSRAISYFCAAKKKWELPLRLEIFENEMRGYRRLGKEYGLGGVAGHGNHIPGDQKAALKRAVKDGIAKGDPVLFQYGLKGLQKLKFSDFDRPDGNEYYEWRYEQYSFLYDVAEKYCPDDHDVWKVIEVVNYRNELDLGIGYHELNCIGDALMGEPYESGLLSANKRKAALARPPAPAPVGIWPKLPLYAHDNHTYGGKALMRRYPEQLKAGIEQTDLDFRWCGAYFGVGYRYLAFKQFSDIGEWHKVKWPKWLFAHVEGMFY